MSGKLVAQVWERDGLKDAEQKLLLAMADHAYDDGSRCFPSLARLAWKTGYSERYVKMLVKGLKERAVLVVVREARQHLPVEYRIDLDVLPEKPPFGPSGVIPSSPLRAPGVAPSSPLSAKEPPGEAEILQFADAPGVNPSSPETLEETTATTETEKKELPATEASSGGGGVVDLDAEVEALWAFWIERRQPSRTKLMASHLTQLRRALTHGFTPEDLRLAMVGLLNSRWHQQHDRLVLSAIFKTKPGGDSFADQVGRFIEDGKKAGGAGNPSDADARIVLVRQSEILRAHDMPGHYQAQQIGERAEKWLEEHGWRVVRDDDQRPRFERKAVGE